VLLKSVGQVTTLVAHRILTAVEDVFAHAMLGVDYFVEAHGQGKLKHQITLDNTAVVP